MAAVRQFADLPAEVVERVMLALAPRDLARANAASRLFRGLPGGPSPVEHALRVRAHARGHVLPAAMPEGPRTWTAELLSRERVLVVARAHAHVVAAGGFDLSPFSAFVDAEGGLLTCGEEEEEGSGNGGSCSPVAVAHAEESGSVSRPTRVASLVAVRVSAVAAGLSHLLALSDAGAVWACGDNEFGQLGLGDSDTRYSCRQAHLPANEAAVCISAGGLYSLALSTAGWAYSWGSNPCGQLGHGDEEERWEPTRVEALDGVRVGGISAGGEHMLLLSASGAVYSCGANGNGELGHGDRTQYRSVPRRIEMLAGVFAVRVSAGFAHSLVLDREGGAHSFGRGDCGCLGHGDSETQLEPRRIEALAGVHAVHAAAGATCSAVLGADGSLHTFGDNWAGALGHPGSGITLPPSRVQALAHEHVMGCTFGDDHALYVTADGSVHSCGRQSAALGRGLTLPRPAVDQAADWAAGENLDGRNALVRIEPLPPLLLQGPVVVDG